jgi:hypothetical protein
VCRAANERNERVSGVLDPRHEGWHSEDQAESRRMGAAPHHNSSRGPRLTNAAVVHRDAGAAILGEVRNVRASGARVTDNDATKRENSGAAAVVNVEDSHDTGYSRRARKPARHGRRLCFCDRMTGRQRRARRIWSRNCALFARLGADAVLVGGRRVMRLLNE